MALRVVAPAGQIRDIAGRQCRPGAQYEKRSAYQRVDAKHNNSFVFKLAKGARKRHPQAVSLRWARLARMRCPVREALQR